MRTAHSWPRSCPPLARFYRLGLPDDMSNPAAILISTPAAIILDAGPALAARDVIDEIR
jgi:hypothetical protein